jgi:hypothetical protein
LDVINFSRINGGFLGTCVNILQEFGFHFIIDHGLEKQKIVRNGTGYINVLFIFVVTTERPKIE